MNTIRHTSGFSSRIPQNSREIFLVLDHSKFKRSVHFRGGHLQEVKKVFCDRTPPPATCDMIQKSGIQLIVCYGESR